MPRFPALRAAVLATLGLSLLLPSGNTHAWDAHVHPKLNRLAAELVKNSDPRGIYAEIYLPVHVDTLAGGGLDEDENITDNGNTEDNCDATTSKHTLAPTNHRLPIVKEFSFPRSRKHFYHPITGLGVSNRITERKLNKPEEGKKARCLDAVSWARNDEGEGLTWYGAVSTYGYGEESKIEAYFRVGHVGHLIGDMAQPDHVHLEPHNTEGAIQKILGDDVAEALAGTSLDSYSIDNWGKGHHVEPKLSDLKVKRYTSMEDHLTNLAWLTYNATSYHAGTLLKPEDGGNGAAAGTELSQMFDVLWHPGGLEKDWLLYNKDLFNGEQIGDWDGKGGDDNEWYETWWEVNSFDNFHPFTTVESNDVPRGYYFVERNEDARPAYVKKVIRDGDGYVVKQFLNTTKRSLERHLATNLLPIAVDHIAGMYMHFLDVVNHPPILSTVTINQVNCVYDVRWAPEFEQSGDVSVNPEFWPVTGRELVDRCPDKVTSGWINGVDGPAKIRLHFAADFNGQEWGLDDATQTFTVSADDIGKAMESVTVVLGDKPLSGALNPGGTVWSLDLTPPEDGSLDGIHTLKVTGKDRGPHFTGYFDGEETHPRNYLGDELDTDPAVLANVKMNSKDKNEKLYNWEGYTPGTDTTHTVMIDATAPFMTLVSAVVDDQNRTVATYMIEDVTSGLKDVNILGSPNATVDVPQLSPGASAMSVTITVEDRTHSAEVAFAIRDMALNPYDVSVFIPVKAIKRGPKVPPMNTRAPGLVPLVVLADDGFDVFSVDLETVTFGPGGATPEFVGHYQDLDGDRDRDLMMYFPNEDAGIRPTDLSVFIAGKTLDEDFVVSAQAIRTVGRDTVPLRWPEDADLSLVRLRDQPIPTQEVIEPGATPRSSRLLSPLPNPTRAGVRLQYGLVETSTVSLRIYDVRGRLMARVMENETAGPGWHEASWSGRDDQGQQVANGVYYARLVVNGAPTGDAHRFTVLR